MNKFSVRGKPKFWKLNDLENYWIYGFFMEQTDAFGVPESFILFQDEENNFRKENVDFNTVAIFTGFLDKNGQPVWGNSSLTDGVNTYHVVWDHDIGAWMLFNEKFPKALILLAVEVSSLSVVPD